jgi:hypothetical protein
MNSIYMSGSLPQCAHLTTVHNLYTVTANIIKSRLTNSGGREMKKMSIFILSAIALFTIAGCGPGSSVQVTTPNSTMQLSAPGPNPVINQPDALGRVARAGAGLWHGIIAPATLLISFFNSDIRMYEVHNTGSEYDLGFFVGLAIVISIISLLFRMRR